MVEAGDVVVRARSGCEKLRSTLHMNWPHDVAWSGAPRPDGLRLAIVAEMNGHALRAFRVNLSSTDHAFRQRR